jgi:hypothetical protein
VIRLDCLDVALGGIIAAGVLYGVIALIVMQSGVVPARLAPYDDPHAGCSRAAERCWWAGLGFQRRCLAVARGGW